MSAAINLTGQALKVTVVEQDAVPRGQMNGLALGSDASTRWTPARPSSNCPACRLLMGGRLEQAMRYGFGPNLGAP